MEKGVHKYFYEFIVIVAGITISLFFDELAEDFKRDKQEKYFLQNLLANLEDDSIKLKGAINFIVEVESSTTLLLKYHLEKPTPNFNEDEIATSQTNLLQHTIFASNKSVFEELKSTGAFVTIKNKTLKNDLFRYYGAVNAAKENDLSADNVIVNYVYPCLNGQIQLSELALLNARYSFMFENLDKAKVTLPEFNPSLEGRNDFLNAIIIRKGINVAQQQMYTNLMERVKELRVTIKAELMKN